MVSSFSVSNTDVCDSPEASKKVFIYNYDDDYYDARDYIDADDFASDWEDSGDFEDYEDAYDYYKEVMAHDQRFISSEKRYDWSMFQGCDKLLTEIKWIWNASSMPLLQRLHH